MKKINFYLKGATCNTCVKKIYKSLLTLDGVLKIKISDDLNNIEVKFDDNLSLLDFNKKLREDYGSKYTISKESSEDMFVYAPLLVILFSLLVFAFYFSDTINAFMNLYMSSFLIVFGLMKFWNLKEFKNTFAEYDIVASRVGFYGYLYPFLELYLGINLFFSNNYKFTYAFIFILSIVTSIGVLNSVMHKRKIKCACLGTFFNLPMSKITLFENGIMIIMSIIMFFNLI